MLEVDAITSVQLVPLFMEYSIFTFPTVPIVVQVISCVEPTVTLSPPLGEVTVMADDVAGVIENTASLTSCWTISESAALIRTRHSSDGVSGTVQLKTP